MRFLDSLTGRTPANADEGVNVPIAVAPGAGPVTGAPAAAAGLSIGEQLALEAEIEPPAPKPSPKVAVVVAGAAVSFPFLYKSAALPCMGLGRSLCGALDCPTSVSAPLFLALLQFFPAHRSKY